MRLLRRYKVAWCYLGLAFVLAVLGTGIYGAAGLLAVAVVLRLK